MAAERDPGAAASIEYIAQLGQLSALRASKQVADSLLAVGPGDSVLDVGSGPGVDLERLVQLVSPGGAVVAVDSDPAAIAALRSRQPHPAVRALTADALELPFEDQSFAGVRSERMLQHVLSPGRAVAEMARVTASGGRVVLVESQTQLLDSASTLDRGLGQILDRDRGPGQSSLGYFLPLLLRRAGLAEVAGQLHVARIESWQEISVALNLDGLIRRAQSGPDESGDRLLAWADSAGAAFAAGRLHAHMQVLIAVGTRR